MQKFSMDQLQQEPPNPQPTNLSQPQPVIISKNNKTPLIGAIIFLALVIAAAAFYLGSKSNDSPTAVPPTQPSPTSIPPSPTAATSSDLKTVNITKLKDSAFSSFSIDHPKDWTTDTKTEADMMQTLTLSKQGNKIEIYQAPMGGNQCIFEGAMPDGPANDYRKTEYKEIAAGEITLRRLIDNPDKNQKMFSFCSNSKNSKTSFGVPTIFGNITYTLDSNDNKILDEMDKIIESIRSVSNP